MRRSDLGIRCWSVKKLVDFIVNMQLAYLLNRRRADENCIIEIETSFNMAAATMLIKWRHKSRVPPPWWNIFVFQKFETLFLYPKKSILN